MTRLIKNLLLVLRPVIDAVLAIAAIPAGLIMLAYRRFGSRRLPLTTNLLKRIGVFPVRNHYYEPLFDSRLLTQPLNEPRELPGVDFDVPGQLRLLEELRYEDEFRAFVDQQHADADEATFALGNVSYESGDAEFLYQLIRHFQPRTVIEVGSGASTKVARHALAMNSNESGRTRRHVCIEPYEQPWLDSFRDIELIREKVETCGLDWARELGKGDLLFIDSSHVIRPQGDVLHEYLDILPRLRSGVIVHVHDIFSPRDYLETWVKDDVRFWNEQYLLEATLGNRARYEVIAAVNLLKHEHYDELKRVCPFLEPEREPGSFYFRVK